MLALARCHWCRRWKSTQIILQYRQHHGSRSRARRLSGGALIVKTLVGLYVLAAADDEDTSDDGNERKQPVGKLHVFAIDSGARTAKQLAISSILAQLPPSENVEQLRRMREYGDAFNAAHRLRLATPNKPKPQPQQNKPSPRGM